MKLTQRGMTLVELMIATAMIGIGIIAAAGTFTAIQRSIQSSKYHTLATNIAQEKMQIVMQKPYYDVIVTTLPATRTDVTPTIYYDSYYFPPDTLTEGGISFTRYTYIQVASEDSGNIKLLDPLTPDTGMRQITETVVWATDTGNKSLTIKSVLNNPNTAMASTWLRGVVSNGATGIGIKGALVDAAENIGWRDTADSSGTYAINLTPGSYNFAASAMGYYTSIIPKTVLFNNSTALNFSLTAIASGTINGTAWIDNHLVISQVVASTGPSGNMEYVDLYNPTTGPINMGTNGGNSTPNVWTIAFDAANPGNIQALTLVYISTYIPAYGYYLITNTGDGGGSGVSCDAITINNTSLTPDACWRNIGGTAPNYKHALQCNPITASGCATGQAAGGFGIGTNGGLVWTSMANATKYDAIAWSGTGSTTPNSYETSPAATNSGLGLALGESFVRRLDTTTATSNVLGNAYDTDNNLTDFIFNIANALPFTPRTTASRLPPETGTPANGAHISVTDGLSATSTATLTGNPPYALFSVPGVATGTWIVFIDSNSSSAEIDSATVVANSTTSIPNNSTSPTWPAANIFSSVLSTNGIVGIINGKVTDTSNVPIPGGITVRAGANSATTSASGNYILRLSTGIYDVVANQNNANSSYESQTQTVNISFGDVTTPVNFLLALGGRVSGFVSRDGTNPLPGVAVVALDQFGTPHDTESSGNDGKFTLVNLTTGIYTVQPSLDSKEVSLPAISTVTVTAGANVWIGTFTVIGAMGQIQGTVSSGGALIKSGVLIVVSSQAITFPPPALSSNTLTSSAFYAASSNEAGNYLVDVRGSTNTTYNVGAMYMHLNNQTPVISTATCSNVTVTAGQLTSGATKACLYFSW